MFADRSRVPLLAVLLLWAPPALGQKKPAIIATLGPSARDAATIKGLMRANASTLRINLSHVSRRDQLRRLLRQARAGAGADVPLLLDLPGAKARLGRLAAGPVALRRGAEYQIVVGKRQPTDGRRAWVDYSKLTKEVEAGARLLIDDGRIVLVVQAVDGASISTRVLRGGTLRDGVGIAVAGKDLAFPPLVATDRRRLKTLATLGDELRQGPLAIGASMVRTPNGIVALREALDDIGLGHAEVVAKIETHGALDPALLLQIMKASDQTMIARGDLKTVVGARGMPSVQQRIVAIAHAIDRPVIVATGFMSGMLNGDRPSRANRDDVARARAQEVDAIMLNETAIGPAEATVRALSALLDR